MFDLFLDSLLDGLKDGAFVYIQNSAGKWIKVYNNQSAF